MKSDRSIKIWLASGCMLIFFMVILGGITRLTGSGLSITEWKVVTGIIPPLNHQRWEIEFEKYKQIPQYKLLNSSFSLDDFKRIYFWEYLHRLTGRLIGLVFIVPFFYFLYKGRISNRLKPQLIVMFLLGAAQGFIGWYMVSSGLSENTRVSHFRLALHLGFAFITFGYIFYTLLDEHYQRAGNQGKSGFAFLIMLLVFIQILAGALVAGTHAGHVYNTWPKMEGQWIPDAVPYAFHSDGFLSLFSNIASVQFIHRMMAYLVLLVILFSWLKQRWEVSSNHARYRIANILLITVLMQVMLGIYTLLATVPVWMGVLHQALAFVLFAFSVYQYYIFRYNLSTLSNAKTS